MEITGISLFITALPKRRPSKGWSSVALSTLSVACLVRDKCHYCKESKEELKLDCPCRKLKGFFCQFLSVVLGDRDCRLFPEPRRFYPLESLKKGKQFMRDLGQGWVSERFQTSNFKFPSYKTIAFCQVVVLTRTSTTRFA